MEGHNIRIYPLSRQHLVQQCELCQQPRALTFHHLIPRKLHRRNRFKRLYKKETLNQGIYICRLCHRGLHKLYDEMTLAQRFRDIESMLADPVIVRHVEWSARQKIAKELV